MRAKIQTNDIPPPPAPFFAILRWHNTHTLQCCTLDTHTHHHSAHLIPFTPPPHFRFAAFGNEHQSSLHPLPPSLSYIFFTSQHKQKKSNKTKIAGRQKRHTKKKHASEEKKKITTHFNINTHSPHSPRSHHTHTLPPSRSLHSLTARVCRGPLCTHTHTHPHTPSLLPFCPRRRHRAHTPVFCCFFIVVSAIFFPFILSPHPSPLTAPSFLTSFFDGFLLCPKRKQCPVCGSLLSLCWHRSPRLPPSRGALLPPQKKTTQQSPTKKKKRRVHPCSFSCRVEPLSLCPPVSKSAVAFHCAHGMHSFARHNTLSSRRPNNNLSHTRGYRPPPCLVRCVGTQQGTARRGGNAVAYCFGRAARVLGSNLLNGFFLANFCSQEQKVCAKSTAEKKTTHTGLLWGWWWWGGNATAQNNVRAQHKGVFAFPTRFCSHPKQSPNPIHSLTHLTYP